jgi:hypothetical protein
MFVRFIVAATTLALGFVLWGIYNFSSDRGKVIDRWEVSNAEFKVIVTAYRERALFTPGAFYVFQSAAKDSNGLHEVLTVRTDEPNPIPHDDIRFINNQTAYFFMSNYYAVTTDSGRTWSIWDAEKNLAYRQHNLWPSIKEVHIESSGTGKMTLPPLVDQGAEVPLLHTNDYGRHWSVK